MADGVVATLTTGPAYRFADWPIPDVPATSGDCLLGRPVRAADLELLQHLMLGVRIHLALRASVLRVLGNPLERGFPT